MRLKRLEIKGFRNLRDISLNFDEKTDLFAFAGGNGQGKTNLLEAIFICALTKSFRTNSNLDLIGFDEDFAQMSAVVEDNGARTLDCIITRTPAKKTLKVNGVIKKAADFVGHLPVVFFSPDDMSILAYAPVLRRRYLDILISQLDHDYLKDLLSYSHIVKQRNSLLRQIRDGKAKESELDFWDEKVVAIGMTLITKRRVVLEELNPVARRYYQEIAGEKDELTIGYKVSAEVEVFAEKLVANRSRDVSGGATSVGPHRDDLQFLFNDHDMALFASRGEWRSLVLALKFAEMELIREQVGTDPVLLLDDVFSELDDARQKYLMKSLEGVQTFLTTTHLEFLGGISSSKQIYEIMDGEVIQSS